MILFPIYIHQMGMEVGKSSHDIEIGLPQSSNAVFSDDEDAPWHSPYSFIFCEQRPSFPSSHESIQPCRSSCITDSSMEVDLENRISDVETTVDKIERDCRICHLSLESHTQESGAPIALGCSCKNDLATAHKHCAETWFKIKGNETCEICGSTAKNVAGPSEAETAENSNGTSINTELAAEPAETRRFWQGHRFLNFLLACMVFAFIIFWFFHYNVPG